MQAITTKFIPCTNTKGSRVKATAQAGSITLSWDHALNPADNHKAAARALVAKYGWNYGEWTEGQLHDGHSVWVCACKHTEHFNIVAPRTADENVEQWMKRRLAAQNA